MHTISLDDLRAELARQQEDFERAAAVLATADENTFVASDRVDELRAVFASTTAPTSNCFIRI